LDAKIDAEMDSLHIKRIDIEDLVDYVYIVRVDTANTFYRDEIVNKEYSILGNSNYLLIWGQYRFLV
jgi:hypothetical protein